MDFIALPRLARGDQAARRRHTKSDTKNSQAGGKRYRLSITTVSRHADYYVESYSTDQKRTISQLLVNLAAEYGDKANEQVPPKERVPSMLINGREASSTNKM